MEHDKPAPAGGQASHFIILQDPSDPNKQRASRLARSHAVKQGLERKRRLQMESCQNFLQVTPGVKPTKKTPKTSKKKAPPVAPLSLTPSNGSLDPFQTLAVDSSRLQRLLSDSKSAPPLQIQLKHGSLTANQIYADRARIAAEPVFSIIEEFSFQSFRSVFRDTGLVDPALLSATMLSLATALGGGNNQSECLGYQVQAMGHVRERMTCVKEAASEATIGAILLLAGVEARLGMTSRVQLHMGAVKQLLDLCEKLKIPLTSGIRRAIFWQDLNSSILANSTRIVDHNTFPELHWARDSLPLRFFQLPPGFLQVSHLLSDEFLDIVMDVRALCCVREYEHCKTVSNMGMAQVINHTASIQSRIMGLSEVSSTIQKACHLAAYIVSFMLCCTVWCSLVLPPSVSLKLLEEMERTDNDAIWSEHPDLQLWLLCVGGASAPRGDAHFKYVMLLRSAYADPQSWHYLSDVLKKFIWSDKAFAAGVKELWTEADRCRAAIGA